MSNEPLTKDSVTGSSSESLVSAELADKLQDADALTVLEVLSLAIRRDDQRVVKYAARVLQAKLGGNV